MQPYPVEELDGASSGRDLDDEAMCLHANLGRFDAGQEGKLAAHKRLHREDKMTGQGGGGGEGGMMIIARSKRA